MKYLVLACSLLQTILFCSAQDRYHVPYLAIQKLTTGRAICTLLRSGAVKCWGDDSYDSNTRGLLGLGGTHDDIGNRGLSVADMGDNLPIVWLGNKAAPVDIQSVIFTCVLFRDKSVKCWGGGVSGIPQAIAGGSLRSMGSNLQPLPKFPSPIQKMAVGSHHVCFLLENNELRCIGQNKFGELGTQHKDARVVENSIAVNVGQDEANLIVSITAGIGNSCAVFSTGKAKCWGYNGSGVLGQGDRVHRGQKYGELGENLNYIDLGFGGVDNVEILQMDITLHACAIFRLKSDGINSKPRLKCWGDSEFGQSGVGTENRGDEPDEMGNNLPEVSLGTDFTPKLLRVGNAHTCVVRDDDLAMKCFGCNNHGQLGQGSDIEARGTTASQMGDNLPFTILELGESEKIIDVQLSTDTTCVQTTKGIKCFGSNSNGRLGIGKPGDAGSTKESMKNLEYVNLGSVCPPHSNDNGDGRCKCRAGSYGPACEPVRCDTEKGVCSIAGGCSGLYGTGACDKCLGNNYGEDCNGKFYTSEEKCPSSSTLFRDSGKCRGSLPIQLFRLHYMKSFLN